MNPSKSAIKLAELIKKAINDQQLTTAEYDEILRQVQADHHVDRQEKELLHQLQELIDNGSVAKVP